MPPLPNVASVLRCTFVHTDSTDTNLTSRIFIEYSGTAPTAAQLATFATACATAWNSDLAPLVDTSCSLTGVDVVDLTSPSSPTAIVAVSHAGTRSGTAMALNTCVCLNYTILRRYRGGKPRGFWRMGVTSDSNGPKIWGATFISAVESAFGSFLTAIYGSVWTGGGTLQQVNVSYYQGFTNFLGPTGRYRQIPTLRTGGPHVDGIQSSVCDTSIGTQRRRIRAPG